MLTTGSFGSPFSIGENGMAKKAVVIRGVYIRGTAYAEGTVGVVGNRDTVKAADEAFIVSHQEFDELRSSNYLAAYVAPPAPEPKPEPPKVDKSGK